MHTKINLFVAATLLLAGCDKSAPAPTTPDEEEQAPVEPGPADEVAAEEPEPAPEPEPEPPPKDSFTVATFNVQWAHDTLVEGKETKRTASSRAQTDEDWEWKYMAIGKVIAEAKPEIIALHEVGGYLEVADIATAAEEAGGLSYNVSFVDSEDKLTGHHSAILSVFPVVDERRLDIAMRRHMLAEFTLPSGGNVTVVAINPPEGSFKKPAASRRKQVASLLRELKKIRAEQPVVILASMGSNITTSDEEYAASAGGMIAGAATKKTDDDCADSAAEPLVIQTTRDEKLADRVFSCGLAMRDAEAAGQELIMREGPDVGGDWHANPADTRDVSDHLMVLAEIELPKAEVEGEEAAE